MSELFNNIRAAWAGSSGGKRSAFIVLAFGILVLTLIASIWAFRSNYSALFTDLDARDASAIVEELKRMKVDYKLADGGTKILVDQKTVHETRLNLMGRGVPLSGGVGFEIFDNKDVGMTEYTQRINYQRALQGELARTIMSIDQVKLARVHLVVAETALFKRERTKSKASVSLVLKPGYSLGPEQITGIQRLVAASVPGLDPGAVTVLDQGGVALSAPIEGEDSYMQATGKLRLKKNAEDYFVRKISSVLDRTFGPGQAIVSVDVTLDFDEVKRTQQTVLPVRATSGDEPGAVVRKRQSVYRDSKGAVTRTVNGDTAYAGASPNLTSTTDVEYELGKAIEQVVSLPGGIKRVSVGVVVPDMDAEQVGRVQEVVGMIVGYRPERGDAISVHPINQMMARQENQPLVTAVDTVMPDPPMTAPAAQPIDYVARLLADPKAAAPYAVLLAVGLLIGAIVAAAWSRRRRRGVTVREASLTEEQRRVRLSEIKSWLEAERSKGVA